MNATTSSNAEEANRPVQQNPLSETIQKFQQLLAMESRIQVASLSRELGVTRQTVYNWLARRKAGMEISAPGRPRKYVTETSVAVRLRIPRSIAQKLAGEGSDSKRSRKLRIELEQLICAAAADNDFERAGALR